MVDSVFYVLGKESLESLDGVGLFISRAFSNLFVKHATIVDKFVSFNLLVTKFEAYLKKLFFLMKGREVEPQYEGQSVSWKDVIHAVRPLWNLKYSDDAEYQKLYQNLLLVKGWRNDESHISPTASEQELDAAINIIITMYFYVTGSCITALEMKEQNMSTGSKETTSAPKSPASYVIGESNASEYGNSEENNNLQMAADSLSVENLDESTRLEILKQSLEKLVNYGYRKKNSVFCKQRHWEAVYRIATDYGFVIDGDYDYFKKVIDDMQLPDLPYALTTSVLRNANKGVYAQNIQDWNSNGLEGKNLAEYDDIKNCADTFEIIIKNQINAHKK